MAPKVVPPSDESESCLAPSIVAEFPKPIVPVSEVTVVFTSSVKSSAKLIFPPVDFNSASPVIVFTVPVYDWFPLVVIF